MALQSPRRLHLRALKSHLSRALVLCAFAAGLVSGPAMAQDASRPLRFGLTATYLYDLFPTHEKWRSYMERKLNRPVEFVRRDNYAEAVNMLLQRELHFAWICDYPFADNKDRLRLLAVPVYKGRSYYRSYLIVQSSNKETTSLLQLKDSTFAYVDPYSNTGYLTTRFQILEGGGDPSKFFRKAFFTRSHRKVVEAVAVGLAAGGAVGSYIWDSLEIIDPKLTASTRVIWKSPEYGFPPIVAQPSLPEEDYIQIQKMFIDMKNNEEGKALLKQLNLDGFTEGNSGLYERVLSIMNTVENQ